MTSYVLHCPLSSCVRPYVIPIKRYCNSEHFDLDERAILNTHTHTSARVCVLCALRVCVFVCVCVCVCVSLYVNFQQMLVIVAFSHRRNDQVSE